MTSTRVRRIGIKNRRLPDYHHQEFGDPAPTISDETLDRITNKVGLSISAERREALKADLAGVRDMYTSKNKAPAPREVTKRLSAVRKATEALWDALGITMEPNDIGEHLRTVDIHSALYGPINDAANKWGQAHEFEYYSKMEIPENVVLLERLFQSVGISEDATRSGAQNLYSDSRLRDIIYALAMLIGWLSTAQNQLASRTRKNPVNKKPDYAQLAMTLDLARAYERAFDLSPRATNQGPWYNFLGASFYAITKKSLTDEALKKLWQRAKRSVGPDIRSMYSFLQGLRDLRDHASRLST